MKVSVIIPCYNEEKYIADCLNSLSQQSHLPDEVIICNNNSTDNSVKITKKFEKKLPLIIIHQSVKGIIPTAEKAWRATTGDIIIKTDADAVFPKNWIKNIVYHFILDPNLAACGGEWIPHKESLFWIVITKYAFILGDIFLPVFRGFKLLAGPNIAIRRQAMEQIGGYLTNDPYILDDQLISYKLSQSKLKYARFADCWNYHSGRQFHQGIRRLFKYFICGLFPKLYPGKST